MFETGERFNHEQAHELKGLLRSAHSVEQLVCQKRLEFVRDCHYLVKICELVLQAEIDVSICIVVLEKVATVLERL